MEWALVALCAVVVLGSLYSEHRYHLLVSEMAKMLASRSFGEFVAGENALARAKAQKGDPKPGPEVMFE